MPQSVFETILDVIAELNECRMVVNGRNFLSRFLNHPVYPQRTYSASSPEFAFKIEHTDGFMYLDLYFVALGRTHDEYSNILLTLLNKETLVRKYYYLDCSGFVSFANLSSGTWYITMGLSHVSEHYADKAVTQDLKQA